jgi:hypothetical protein
MDRAALGAAELGLASYRGLIDQLGIEPRHLAGADQFAIWLRACNQWLIAEGRSERLVAASKGQKTSALSYERRIVEQGEIETRDDLHDSMNALVWLQYPRAKRALSMLHLEQAGVSADLSRRGPRRDAATLFDEHGLVILTRDPVALSLLEGRQWQSAWLTHRAMFLKTTRLVVFGHALLDRLARPFKGLTGHAMLLLWQQEDWPHDARLDQLLQQRIAALASPRALLACPLMGWPGYAARQDLDYYADRSVFRSAS